MCCVRAHADLTQRGSSLELYGRFRSGTRHTRRRVAWPCSTVQVRPRALSLGSLLLDWRRWMGSVDMKVGGGCKTR